MKALKNKNPTQSNLTVSTSTDTINCQETSTRNITLVVYFTDNHTVYHLDRLPGLTLQLLNFVIHEETDSEQSESIKFQRGKLNKNI